MTKNITVLLVEDNESTRNEMVEILSGEVLELSVASNALEGYELYKTHTPDLIITDIQMPKIDGFKFIDRVLQENSQQYIIVTTAFCSTEYLLKSIKLNISNYLLKPIVLTELLSSLDRIATIIEDKKKFRENEKLLEEYKMAVDSSEIVSKTNLKGVITYVNDAFCDISGYSRDELLNKSHNIVRHSSMENYVFKNMWETITSKKEWRGKIKNRAKDGSMYIVDTIITPVINSNNEIEEFISIRKDITKDVLDREKLEVDLRESITTIEEKEKFINEYENALQTNALFCRTTTEGKIITASKPFIDLVGTTREAISDISYTELIEEDEFKVLQEEVLSALKQTKTWTGNVKHKSLNGKTYHLNSSFIPIKDINGNVNEVICFYIDLTKQIDLNSAIIDTQREVIARMGAIGETRSKETGLHVKRVAEYSKLLALKYGLSAREAEEIKMASPMHDIGKVGIPDYILNKTSKLSEAEFEIMKTHATVGAEMLSGTNQALLQNAAIISREHHEKWDGTGYPEGKKEENIHIYGRITAIADVFDALGHDRIYKKAWPLEDILIHFKKESGKHFDPNLIDIFMQSLDEFLLIQEKLK